MTRPFTIIFDLDGTLVDTAGDLVATLNFILADICPPLPMDVARPLIGHGARALIEKSLQLNSIAYDATRLGLLSERFMQYYSAHIADHSTIHTDLREVLDGFMQDGFNLGICTNKRTPLANQLLQAVKLDHYFSAVIGSGELPFSKPDPRMLEISITESGGAVNHAVLIGDSKTDVDTGRAAKVPVILVDFGYTEVPVHELNANAVISEWRALGPAIEKLELAYKAPIR